MAETIQRNRPYLVVAKLIEQPTWGGTYIAASKGWADSDVWRDKKIGQSYELFDKSNLSLLASSDDPRFIGERTDVKHVDRETRLPDSVPLTALVSSDPAAVLGSSVVERFGPVMPLLNKFTQALGNSFQLHIKDGEKNDRWKPKPESWYFFEPGLVTCGVKRDVNWGQYEQSVTELNEKILAVAGRVTSGAQTYESGRAEIDRLVEKYNPWQYVNVLDVPADTLIDLSPCGIHHSWEEDPTKIPLGNVLYEVQLNVMDDVATIRNFDKGKMSSDGTVRPLHIDDYFRHIDRSVKANNPQTHMRQAKVQQNTETRKNELLLQTKYYTLQKLTLKKSQAAYHERIDSFRHLFVKTGSAVITAAGVSVRAGHGHSVFIPAACGEMTLTAGEPDSNVLISF